MHGGGVNKKQISYKIYIVYPNLECFDAKIEIYIFHQPFDVESLKVDMLKITSSFLMILCTTAIYGLLHSLLASLKAKEMASILLGQYYKWYRLIYNIFAFLSLLPVLALAVILPDKPLYSFHFPWNIPVLLLQLAGLVIATIAVFQTGLGHLAGLSQLREKGENPTPGKLVTDGLYKYVRHPIYSGSILFLWATPQMTWNGLALRLAFTLYFIIGGMVEEKKLVAEFGEVYRAYRLRTPMLIPGLKKTV